MSDSLPSEWSCLKIQAGPVLWPIAGVLPRNSFTPSRICSKLVREVSHDPRAQAGPQLAMPSNLVSSADNILICQKFSHIGHKLASIRSAVAAILLDSEENTTSVTATCFRLFKFDCSTGFQRQDREWSGCSNALAFSVVFHCG